MVYRLECVVGDDNMDLVGNLVTVLTTDVGMVENIVGLQKQVIKKWCRCDPHY